MSVVSRAITAGVMTAAVVIALTGCSTTTDSGDASSPSDTAAAKVDSIADLLPASIADAGTVKIAASAYAPAVIAPTGGATVPTGWDADLATAAAQVLGISIEWTVIPFDGLITGLQADRTSAAVGDIGINADRLEKVSFVKNHYAYDVLVSNADADEPETFSEETDICGRTVGVLLGSQEANYLNSAVEACRSAGQPDLTVSTFQDQATVNLALAQGRIELNLTDDGAAAAMLEQSPDTFTTSLADFVPILPTGWAFGNNDDTAELTAAFSAALDHLIENGQYDEIMEEYGVGEDGRVESAETYSLAVDGARQDVETTRE